MNCKLISLLLKFKMDTWESLRFTRYGTFFSTRKIPEPNASYANHTQVVTNDKNHHKDVVLMKRYNQFADLDAKLTGKYKDTHMFEKHFPKLSAYAPKKMKLLTDHFSKEFLTERRYALTDWLNSLSEFPGMSQDPIFRTFLGVPAIRA